MSIPIKVASLSGGRESTAMDVALTELNKKAGKGDFFARDKKGLRIFADTGRDPVGRAMVDYLNNLGWKITIVQSKYGDIQDYYTNTKLKDEKGNEGHALPMRANKACSYKFKIMPIINYLKEKFGKNQTYVMYYGFTIAKKDVKRKERMISPEYRRSYVNYKFPLIDIFKYDRQHCGDLCMKTFGFIPERSACDLCFEQTLSDWKKLFARDPKRALEIMHWEQDSLIYKQYGYGLNRVPLDVIFKQRAINTKGQILLFSEEQIKAIEKEQEMYKAIDPACACMGEAGLFMDELVVEKELGESLADVGFRVLVDWD